MQYKSLLVSEETDVQINDEFGKVATLVSENKLGINMIKIKTIIFHRPHPKNLLLAATIPGNEKVLSATLIGIWLQSEMGIHVDNFAKICKQRLLSTNSILKVDFEAVINI